MGILEDVLAALKENTATLKSLSGKTAEVATAAPKASAAPKATAATKPADAEPEEKRGRGRPPRVKGLTVTEMAEKAREFCEAAGDDEAEFKDRRKHITSLAEKFGVAKFSEIKGDEQKEALDSLQEFIDGGPEEADGDEGDAGY